MDEPNRLPTPNSTAVKVMAVLYAADKQKASKIPGELDTDEMRAIFDFNAKVTLGQQLLEARGEIGRRKTEEGDRTVAHNYLTFIGMERFPRYLAERFPNFDIERLQSLPLEKIPDAMSRGKQESRGL